MNIQQAAAELRIEITAIKNRQISVDANAFLNIRPDDWDARGAYIDRRDLLRLIQKLEAGK